MSIQSAMHKINQDLRKHLNAKYLQDQNPQIKKQNKEYYSKKPIKLITIDVQKQNTQKQNQKRDDSIKDKDNDNDNDNDNESAQLDFTDQQFFDFQNDGEEEEELKVQKQIKQIKSKGGQISSNLYNDEIEKGQNARLVSENYLKNKDKLFVNREGELLGENIQLDSKFKQEKIKNVQTEINQLRTRQREEMKYLRNILTNQISYTQNNSMKSNNFYKQEKQDLFNEDLSKFKTHDETINNKLKQVMDKQSLIQKKYQELKAWHKDNQIGKDRNKLEQFYKDNIKQLQKQYHDEIVQLRTMYENQNYDSIETMYNFKKQIDERQNELDYYKHQQKKLQNDLKEADQRNEQNEELLIEMQLDKNKLVNKLSEQEQDKIVVMQQFQQQSRRQEELIYQQIEEQKQSKKQDNERQIKIKELTEQLNQVKLNNIKMGIHKLQNLIQSKKKSAVSKFLINFKLNDLVTKNKQLRNEYEDFKTNLKKHDKDDGEQDQNKVQSGSRFAFMNIFKSKPVDEQIKQKDDEIQLLKKSQKEADLKSIELIKQNSSQQQEIQNLKKQAIDTQKIKQDLDQKVQEVSKKDKELQNIKKKQQEDNLKLDQLYSQNNMLKQQTSEQQSDYEVKLKQKQNKIDQKVKNLQDLEKQYSIKYNDIQQQHKTLLNDYAQSELNNKRQEQKMQQMEQLYNQHLQEQLNKQEQELNEQNYQKFKQYEQKKLQSINIQDEQVNQKVNQLNEQNNQLNRQLQEQQNIMKSADLRYRQMENDLQSEKQKNLLTSSQLQSQIQEKQNIFKEGQNLNITYDQELNKLKQEQFQKQQLYEEVINQKDVEMNKLIEQLKLYHSDNQKLQQQLQQGQQLQKQSFEQLQHDVRQKVIKHQKQNEELQKIEWQKPPQQEESKDNTEKKRQLVFNKDKIHDDIANFSNDTNKIKQYQIRLQKILKRRQSPLLSMKHIQKHQMILIILYNIRRVRKQ